MIYTNLITFFTSSPMLVVLDSFGVDEQKLYSLLIIKIIELKFRLIPELGIYAY